MPRMGIVTLKTRNEHVPFGSLIHKKAVIYVGGGDSHVKYYIIAAAVISISISFLSLYLDLRSRLNKNLPPRACHKFLFRGIVRRHEREVGSVPQEDGSPGSYNMTNMAPGPVNDPAGYPAYPNHTDGGDKFDSVQEPTKRADEENALPAYEPPLGPPPPAVTKQ